MSVQALTYVFGLGTDVSGTDRLVLLALANWANEDGESWPKVETIAKAVGSNRPRTVQTALANLEQAGYIVRHLNAFQGSRGQIPADRRPNVYRLTWLNNGVAQTVTPSGNGVTQSDATGWRNPSPRGVTQSDIQNRQGEPSIEPRSKVARSTQEAPDSRTDRAEAIDAEYWARVVG